jgi:hypothetical protein
MTVLRAYSPPPNSATDINDIMKPASREGDEVWDPRLSTIVYVKNTLKRGHRTIRFDIHLLTGDRTTMTSLMPPKTVMTFGPFVMAETIELHYVSRFWLSGSRGLQVALIDLA